MPEPPIAFTVRWDRVDAQLLSAAEAHQHLGTLAEAEAREGLSSVRLSEIVGKAMDPPDHFGPTTSLFWGFVHALFLGGDGVVAHPAGFEAKSVLAADVWAEPVPGAGKAFLAVWSGVGYPPGAPVLVPFPRVAEILLNEVEGSFADSCHVYRELVAETIARVNLVAPAALALGHQAAADRA